MPVGQSIWKVGQKPQRLMYSKLDSEQDPEEMICNDIGILDDQWMLIERPRQSLPGITGSQQDGSR